MLSAAREGEWERMIEQEQARRPLIEAFFATPPERHEAPAVAEFIREVQAIDAEVMVLAERGKQAAAEVLRLLTNRNRAADAYTAAARRR
ncbi:flagellar protein FliT [Endothiovibrio diazotrophicus]